MSNFKDINVREELLKAAFELFFERGYDKTSVNAIIQAVGVTKGAFYHYFESKEDMLTEISKRYANDSVKILKEVRKVQNLSAVEKLNKVISQMYAYKIETKDTRRKIKTIFEDNSNAKLQKRIFESIGEMAKIEYRFIVEEGVNQGDFNTQYIDDAAVFIFHMAFLFNQEIARYVSNDKPSDNEKKSISNTIKFYEEAFYRILGAKDGSIKLYEVVMDYIEKISYR